MATSDNTVNWYFAWSTERLIPELKELKSKVAEYQSEIKYYNKESIRIKYGDSYCEMRIRSCNNYISYYNADIIQVQQKLLARATSSKQDEKCIGDSPLPKQSDTSAQNEVSFSLDNYPPLPKPTKPAGNKKIIPGFSINADILVTYEGKKGSLDWQEQGLTLLFEDSDLSSETNECPIHVSAGDSGTFRYPTTMEAASSFYHIDCHKQLNASVTIQIKHTAPKEDVQHLFFVCCSDNQPPYDYKIIHGGHFTSTYGQITVKHFSLYSTVRIIEKFGVRGILSLIEKSYEASLYRSVHPKVLPSGYSWNIYVSAVKNCSVFQKSVENYIKKEYDEEVKLESRSIVQFNSMQDCVTISTKFKTKNKEHKISLEALGSTSLRKIDISSYVDACPPHVKFVLEAEPGCSLKARFKLEGCQEPRNFLELKLHHSIPLDVSASFEDSIKRNSIEASESHGSIQEGHPSMDNLTLMKWTDDTQQKFKLRLIDEFSPKWREAGDLLGISLARLESIDMTHRDTRLCCREVIAEWLRYPNEVFRYPRTWEGLCKLAEDLQLANISIQIKKVVNLK